MNRIASLLLTLITLFSFSACHKSSNAPNVQTIIVGKWNLQKQSYVQYINDVKQVDTVCLSADTLSAYVQFNADKSYKSEGVYFSKNLHNPINMEAQVSGIYASSNSALTVSNTMAGLVFFAAIYNIDSSYNINAPITNSVHTSKLNAITSNNLSIHTEDSYTTSANSVSTSYKVVNDFYYTK